MMQQCIPTSLHDRRGEDGDVTQPITPNDQPWLARTIIGLVRDASAGWDAVVAMGFEAEESQTEEQLDVLEAKQEVSGTTY